MATILDLFKSQKKDLYGGVNGQTYIESQGVINIPRQASLVASGPGGISNLIGQQLGGLIKGSANRPTDTIYPNNKFFSKPVSLIPGAVTGTKYAADALLGGDKDFYVKKTPGNIPNIASAVLQGASTPASLAQRELSKIVKTGAGSVIKGILDKDRESFAGYGPSLTEDNNGKVRRQTKKFTEYAPVYKGNGDEGFVQTGLIKRPEGLKYLFDSVLMHITKESTKLTIVQDKDGENYIREANYEDLQKFNRGVDVPYVGIAPYENPSNPTLLPGTISGLTEDITPEWTNFKYLGSPFNLYRYIGVERSLQFSIKLYYTDNSSKVSMIRKIHNLKEFVFPHQDMSAISYPSSQSAAILAIKPNLVWLTVNGLYENVLCIIDSLSFSIDDGTPWPSTVREKWIDLPDDYSINGTKINTSNGSGREAEVNSVTITNDTKNNVYEKPYPGVIDISFGFKVIENVPYKKDSFDSSFEYRKFDNVSKTDKSYFNEPEALKNLILEEKIVSDFINFQKKF